MGPALDLETQSTDGNPTAHTVGASAGPAPLIVLGCYETGSGSIDPRTFSPAKDGEITSSQFHYLAYKIHNSAPADVSIDMDDEGIAATLHTMYLACT